jgi:hypothetical protein
MARSVQWAGAQTSLHGNGLRGLPAPGAEAHCEAPLLKELCAPGTALQGTCDHYWEHHRYL